MNEILNGKTDISLDIALAIQNLTDIPVEFIIKSEYKKKIENYLYLKYSEEELKNMLKKRFLIKELEEREWIKFNNITNIVQNYIDIFEYLKVRDFEALDKINEKTFTYKFKLAIDNLTAWGPNQVITYNINLSPNKITFAPVVDPWENVEDLSANN